MHFCHAPSNLSQPWTQIAGGYYFAFYASGDDQEWLLLDLEYTRLLLDHSKMAVPLWLCGLVCKNFVEWLLCTCTNRCCPNVFLYPWNGKSGINSFFYCKSATKSEASQQQLVWLWEFYLPAITIPIGQGSSTVYTRVGLSSHSHCYRNLDSHCYPTLEEDILS